MDKQRLYTLATIVLTIVGALIVLYLVPLPSWAQILVVVGIVVSGQTLRYYLSQRLYTKARGKLIKRKDMETEVREYFQQHPDIAKRFLRMDELRRKGNYHDAYSLATALKKEDLTPIVRRYLDYKIKAFHKFTQFGL
ncbi:MAG TPA: hypothetical protein VKM55_17160 [Candidatus Lokiarchaeia archaeon]|nr:hypothetical protein [Candidatus Lokiarchaeia archaeon]